MSRQSLDSRVVPGVVRRVGSSPEALLLASSWRPTGLRWHLFRWDLGWTSAPVDVRIVWFPPYKHILPVAATLSALSVY